MTTFSAQFLPNLSLSQSKRFFSFLPPFPTTKYTYKYTFFLDIFQGYFLIGSKVAFAWEFANGSVLQFWESTKRRSKQMYEKIVSTPQCFEPIKESLTS